MDLNTAAAVISYISKIEQESASFYEKWASSHESLRQAFLSFAEGNKRHEKNIKLTYYSVISDALETGFCFKGLTAEVSVPLLKNDASPHDILAASIEIETEIQEFYMKAAGLSKSLLADIPRAMERVAKDKDKRKIKLRLLMEEIES